MYPPTHHRSFFAPILCGHGQATQRSDRIFCNSFDAMIEVIISKVHFKKWQKIICQRKGMINTIVSLLQGAVIP